MRITACVCLAAMLSGSVQLGAAAQASPQVAGVIELASHARLDGAATLPGSTVHFGDVLDTDVGGTLQTHVRGMQISLAASTEAKLADAAEAIHISLARGGIRFSSPANTPLAIEAPVGILRSENGYAASGMITVNNPLEFVISADDQNLIFDNDGELHLIEAGKSYRVTVSADTDADADATPVPINHKRRRKVALYLIGGAAAALAALAV